MFEIISMVPKQITQASAGFMGKAYISSMYSRDAMLLLQVPFPRKKPFCVSPKVASSVQPNPNPELRTHFCFLPKLVIVRFRLVVGQWHVVCLSSFNKNQIVAGYVFFIASSKRMRATFNYSLYDI